MEPKKADSTRKNYLCSEKLQQKQRNVKSYRRKIQVVFQSNQNNRQKGIKKFRMENSRVFLMTMMIKL